MNRDRVVLAAVLAAVTVLPHASSAASVRLTVRFEGGAVATPTGLKAVHPTEASFRSPALQTALLAAGVQRLERIFPDFRPGDRFSTNPLGEKIVLADLSVYFSAVLAEGISPEQAQSTLKNAPGVHEVVLPGKFQHHDPNDTYFPLQWWLNDTNAPGQDPCGPDAVQDADINAPEAWQIYAQSASDANVRVGVIDSGVDSFHPDLAGRVEVGGAFGPNDYPGGIPPAVPCTYECTCEQISPNLPPWTSTLDTGQGHGTAIAGIIAAKGNDGTGVAGVAWNVTIKAYKMETPCIGWSQPSYVAAAIEAARTANPPVQIINMSHGFWAEDPAHRDAVRNAFYCGRLLVASMGNGRGDGYPKFPAAFGPPVCAVGAIYDDGLPAYTSERGDYIDLAAPGGNPPGDQASGKIVTTHWRPSGLQYYSICETGQGVSFGGTSAAAATVSGVAALVLARARTLGPLGLQGEDLQQIMVRTARDVVDGDDTAVGWDIASGAGLVRADAALNYLQWPRQLLHSQTTSMVLVHNGGVPDSQLVTGRTYRDVPGLNPDLPYDAIRYRMRATIAFPYAYNMLPDAWVRSSGTLGLASDAAFFDNTREVMSGLITSLTTTEATVETYFYRVIRDGQPSILLPEGLQYSEAAVALTTVGTPDYGGGGCDPPPGGGPPDCGNETESFDRPVAEGTTQWFDITGRRITKPEVRGVYFTRSFQQGKWTVRRVAIVK